MSELKTTRYLKAMDELMSWAPEEEDLEDFQEFKAAVRALVSVVQEDTELSLLLGETRHLGEKHMLLTCLYSAISLCSRPVQREASYNMAQDALNTYLGISMPPLRKRRPRRKLLHP